MSATLSIYTVRYQIVFFYIAHCFDIIIDITLFLADIYILRQALCSCCTFQQCLLLFYDRKSLPVCASCSATFANCGATGAQFGISTSIKYRPRVTPLTPSLTILGSVWLCVYVSCSFLFSVKRGTCWFLQSVMHLNHLHKLSLTDIFRALFSRNGNVSCFPVNCRT